MDVDGGNSPCPTPAAWLRDRGATTSDVTMMRSLLVAPSGERTLIELKAVDAAWPLVGAAATSRPSRSPKHWRTGRHFGLLADPLVLDRLGLKTGDIARLGTATHAGRRRADRRAGPRRDAAIFGPRVLISQARSRRPA